MVRQLLNGLSMMKKMIIISGASRGIGNYLFNYYYNTCIVAGTYLNTPLENESIRKVDVTKYNEVEDFIKSLHLPEQLVLINCAGISYNAFTHKSDVLEWKKVIDVNVLGTYHLIRALLPAMRERGYGRIINFSSVVAQKAALGVSAYAASKSALWGMSKVIAKENGALGITINNINLGYVQTGMIEQISAESQEILRQEIPCVRFCHEEEIAKTIDLLIGTAYYNGSNFDLNGGLY